MDLRAGCAYWLLKSGLLASYPSVDRDLKCDVAVIGGGITGAMIAWHLVQEGVDVVLVEKREIAFGSTAASTGLLLYEVDTHLHRLIACRGAQVAVRSYQLCRQ